MPSIDERIVAISFENQVFEARVAQTMTTLTKLDTALKNMGGTSGFDKIESQANRVTFQGPMSALDKLKTKLSGAGSGAAESLGQIDQAGNKVTLEGPGRAVDKLQGKMGQLSAGSTFSDIEKASDRTTLSGLSNALDNVTGKFSVMAGAASVALGNIGSQAAQKGLSFAKGFSFAPVMDGLHEYQTNLQAIQTIQANTDQPLTKINTSLQDLNKYSDQTIYNFGEMARNIGTFTAAGVDLKTATSSIKGIANMAALSGSNSQQASTAMYQLSQAIASGKVGLQDWNSVVNAGMGGKKLQSALATTAVAMGDIGKNSVKLEGPLKKLTINGESFRESIMAKPGAKPWLSSDVLVNTLATLDGRFSKAALSAELTKDGLKKYSAAQVEAKIATNRTALEQKNGVKYTDAQFASLMKLSDSAFKSATEVKTLGQVFDVAKETIGSGWSASFQSIFGNLKEAKELFTGMSGAINGFINANAMARNKVLHDWKAMGGRQALIDGLVLAWNNLSLILKTVKDAFREIFPAKTGKDLFNMTMSFKDLMTSIIPTRDTLDTLKRIFAGVFAVVHIGWSFVKALAGAFFDLLGVVGKGSGGFLGFIASVGDFLVALDKAITQGDIFKNVFKTITTILRGPLTLILKLARAIGSLFGGQEDIKRISTRTGKVVEFADSLSPLERLIKGIKSAWHNLVAAFDAAKQALEPWFSIFVDKLSGLGQLIGNAISNISFDQLLGGIQTGLLAGLFVILKQAFGKGGGFLDSLSGTLDNVSGVLKGFTGQLQAMQQKVKAQIILLIAAAVTVLAAGIYLLSTIDGDKLAKAMTAVAVGLGELMGAMKLMMSGTGLLGTLQLPIIAAGLIGLAIAVTILAGAMKIFATIKWEDMAKGMVGIAGALTAIALGMKLMPPTLPLTAAGLILIGVALNLIAAAIKVFASMKWEDIGKGLFTMVDALGGIALGMSMMPPNLPLTAAGLILMGIALSLIAGSLKAMGSMDVATLIKGLGAIMIALTGIGLAMWLMPPDMALVAAGLIGVGIALNIIGTALKIMGSIGLFDLVKGLAAMAGSLVILAVGLTLMEGTLPGAAALMAAALALAVLAPTLAFLGTLSWATILKGLLAIALALGTLALVGGLAAGPISALGVALLPLAGVFVLTAGAVFIFAKALSLLGATGGKGIAVMVTALTGFVALIPTLVINFIKGLLGIVDQLTVLAPKVLVALGLLIDTLIAFVIQSAPKLAIAIGVLVDSILLVLVTNTPKIVSAGAKLLMDLLSGLSNNIEQVTNKVSEIINKFLATLAANAPQLVDSGAKVLLAFLQGITNNISKVVVAVTNMVTRFITELTKNVGRVIYAGQSLVLKLIEGIAGLVPRLVLMGANMILKFLDGLNEAIPKIKTKALQVARTFLNNLADGLAGLADIGFKALIRFLNGIADAIRNNHDDLFAAGANIGKAIMEGIMDGFGKMGTLVRKALEKVFNLLPGWAKDVLGISSPSKVFHEIGVNTMKGYADGIIHSMPGVHMTTRQALQALIRESGDAKVIGGFLGKEFITGLTGAMDKRSEAHKRIDDAFGGLKDKLKEQTDKFKTQITEDRGKLKEELDKDHPSKTAIEAIARDIRDNTALLNSAKQAAGSLMSNLKGEKSELISLAASFDQVTANLDKAKQELDKITQARDSFIESTRNQYNTLPDIGALMDSAMAEAALTAQERVDKARKDREEAEKKSRIDQVAAYKKALADRIAATQKYMETLNKLRALGLDDATYQRLLSEGVKDQDFASQLLSGGKASIDQINALDKQLLETSTKLAQDAAANLYQAGVNAAQGLVDGLKQKQTAIQDQMDEIAKAMVRSIKRQLGIRSPSRVMAEMGKFAAQGVVQGLQMATSTVADAAANVGDEAASAMSGSLSQLSDILNSEISSDITITPVLDLTQVRKEAAGLGNLTSNATIAAGTSFGQASAASQEVSASREAAAATAAGGTMFNFEQNNYSPESLSDVEIYRQTKNQLGQLKSALGLAS